MGGASEEEKKGWGVAYEVKCSEDGIIVAHARMVPRVGWLRPYSNVETCTPNSQHQILYHELHLYLK